MSRKKKLLEKQRKERSMYGRKRRDLQKAFMSVLA
ncbi:MAG: hypothetical protein ACLRZ6_10970 [Lachnospiraceae bacterium]